MGYSRQDQARTLYLNRGAYTNYGEPNYTYIFKTNGTGMSVALKAKTNYVDGDTLQFHHGAGGVGYNISSVGNNDILNGSNTVGSVSCGYTRPIYLIMTSQFGTQYFCLTSDRS